METHRHQLHASGEEDILDSVDAACLGVVRNYTVVSGSPWIKFSPEEERVGTQTAASTIAAALLMKEICFRTAEELGMELSEGVWKAIQSTHSSSVSPVQDLANQFCLENIDSGCQQKNPVKNIEESAVSKKDEFRSPKGPTAAVSNKRKKRKKKSQKSEKITLDSTTGSNDETTQEGLAMEQYAELMQKMNEDGSLREMLLREQNNPEFSLPENEQIEYRRVLESRHFLCGLCKVVGSHTRDEAPEHVLESEASLLEWLCVGSRLVSSVSFCFRDIFILRSPRIYMYECVSLHALFVRIGRTDSAPVCRTTHVR
jgi:hypothetical protein